MRVRRVLAPGRVLALRVSDVVRALFAFGACFLSATLAAGSAEAADPRWELGTSVDARDIWLREMPPIDLRSPFDASQRTLPAGTLPSTGSQQFMALTWDTGATVNDRWMLPIFGLQFGWAVGTSPDVVTSLDGTIVHMRPWTSDMLTVLLPGLGVRTKARRWMFEAAVRPVLSFVWMSATAATGTSTSDLGDGHALFAMGGGLRAELEACRRIDPVQRACLLVSPALYEFSSFNGGSIGLRWEVGP
jgi:hypothetical protein